MPDTLEALAEPQVRADRGARRREGGSQRGPLEVCLERLVTGSVGEDWTSRFERYSAAYEPLLRAQEGPPADVHA